MCFSLSFDELSPDPSLNRLGATSVNGSPQKAVPAQTSPRPPMPPSMPSASSSQNGSLYSASLQSVPQPWSMSN